MLRREPDGTHVLVTPVEKLEIDVETTAFRAVEMQTEGQGRDRRIAFRLDSGDGVIAGADHPLSLTPGENGPSPRLAVRLDNIGDIVMLGPALRAMRQALPHAHITLMASPAGSQVAPLLPWVDEVLTERGVWQDASGNSVGTAQVLMSQSDGTITIALPEAQFGTPGSGWGFTVVLTGQDGFSPDQARGFAPTAQPFLFGVCAPDGTAAVCSADPSTVPKAVDVVTPPGVSKATELDPTLGPVSVQPVTVP